MTHFLSRLLIIGTGLVAPHVGIAADVDALLERSFQDLLQVEIQSATKRREQVREIPASVTIVTREEIERHGWTSFEALLRSAPGFFLIDNTEDRFIGTRGAVGGGVQVLVNGIAQHPSLHKGLTATEIARLDIPIESIDRVEIVRGPMSVTYGNNAFLGVINVVTNRIDAHGPRVSASLGTNDSGRLFARVGKTFADGFVTLNLGADRNGGLTGDYADMMGPAQLAALDPAMHRDMDGDLDWWRGSLDLSARWRGWTGNLRLNRRDYGVYAFSPPFDNGTRTRLDTVHASLGYDHRFSDRLGISATGVYSQEDYHISEFDFLVAELDGRQDQSSRRAELELDLRWRPTTTVNAVAGYRFVKHSGIDNQARIPLLGLDRQVELRDVSSHDLFADVAWQASPGWRLLGGLRLTLPPDRYRRTRTDFGGPAPVVTEVRPEDSPLINGRAAALWTPGPDQVLKLSWGTASQDTDEISAPDAERIATLEANYSLTRPRWRLSAGVFQNRLSGLVRTIQRVDPGTGVYLNASDNSGRWRSRGLELIGEARPIDGLSLSASLLWQRTEDLTSDIDPGYSPELLVKLAGSWRHGAFTYAAHANYVGAMEADWDFVAGTTPGVVARTGDRVPGYWDLGLNLRWDPKGAGPFAALNVSNLLDGDNRTPAAELTDFEQGLIGPGRTWTLTLGYAF